LQKKFETNLEDFGECFYVGKFSGDDLLNLFKEAERRNMTEVFITRPFLPYDLYLEEKDFEKWNSYE
jgi:hypothetical protein